MDEKASEQQEEEAGQILSWPFPSSSSGGAGAKLAQVGGQQAASTTHCSVQNFPHQNSRSARVLPCTDMLLSPHCICPPTPLPRLTPVTSPIVRYVVLPAIDCTIFAASLPLVSTQWLVKAVLGLELSIAAFLKPSFSAASVQIPAVVHPNIARESPPGSPGCSHTHRWERSTNRIPPAFLPLQQGTCVSSSAEPETRLDGSLSFCANIMSALVYCWLQKACGLAICAKARRLPTQPICLSVAHLIGRSYTIGFHRTFLARCHLYQQTCERADEHVKMQGSVRARGELFVSDVMVRGL